jgi:lysozyme family protein
MGFEKSFAEVLDVEKGYVNRSSDRGGPTNKGITLKTFSDFLGREATIEELKNISNEDCKKIYKQFYWDLLSLDFVKNENIAHMIFDYGVNAGIRRAAEKIQQVVRVKVDGKIGPETLRAINSMNPRLACKEFTKQIQLYYARIVKFDPSQSEYIEGWINRSHRFFIFF